MLKIVQIGLGLLLIASNALAVEVTLPDLVGEWNYTAWAESETPDARQAVGATITIKEDGTVITRFRGNDVPARLQFENGEIHYTDTNGTQAWQVQSFERNKSLVILHRGALMFLEKP